MSPHGCASWRNYQRIRSKYLKQSTERIIMSCIQTGLPALFKNRELRLLRPGAAMEAGFLEVYPRFGKKKPYLLEQLELFLEEKVRNSGTPPELNIYTQHLMGEYIRNNPLSAQHNACSLKLVRCTRKGFAVIVFTRCFSHIVGSVA
eukprot:9481462-Pyramimonas_sp.AAC.2